MFKLIKSNFLKLIELMKIRASLGSSVNDTKKKLTEPQFYKIYELRNDQNYISTSQPRSMMKFYKIKQEKTETTYERDYRIKYEEVQLWNHDYWAKNNQEFQEGKKQFKINLKQTDLSDDQYQHEKLLPFYKNFLDSNHDRNITYNMEWYKKNLGLLVPAFKANLSRIIKKLKIS